MQAPLHYSSENLTCILVKNRGDRRIAHMCASVEGIDCVHVTSVFYRCACGGCMCACINACERGCVRLDACDGCVLQGCACVCVHRPGVI